MKIQFSTKEGQDGKIVANKGYGQYDFIKLLFKK
jgi:hypothetical protein